MTFECSTERQIKTPLSRFLVAYNSILKNHRQRTLSYHHSAWKQWNRTPGGSVDQSTKSFDVLSWFYCPWI